MIKEDEDYLLQFKNYSTGKIVDYTTQIKNSCDKFIGGGGHASVYSLKGYPNKVIRISYSNAKHSYIQEDTQDWLYKMPKYKIAVNLMKLKNIKPDLPIAKIDNVFFVHANTYFDVTYLNNEYSKWYNLDKHYSGVNKQKVDFYFMLTIMDKLITNHQFTLKDESVINAKESIEKLGITVRDFKIRNIVMDSEGDPILIDYDDWIVPDNVVNSPINMLEDNVKVTGDTYDLDIV